MCGSSAVEAALKCCFINYLAKKRPLAEVSEAEYADCLLNKSEANNLAVLSFKNGFHGRTMGSLSLTRTKPLFKLDVPAFDWPCAEPPRYKYPLADSENEKWNQEQDERSLALVRQKIHWWKKEKGKDVGVRQKIHWWKKEKGKDVGRVAMGLSTGGSGTGKEEGHLERCVGGRRRAVHCRGDIVLVLWQF